MVAGDLAAVERMTAAEIIRLLDLEPHPEGGHYRQTFCDGVEVAGRAASTAIYFLLARGERSHWHRVDAAEGWHYYAGATLELTMAHDNGVIERVRLGNDLLAGERPQAVVPAHVWQAAVESRRLDAHRRHRRAGIPVFALRARATRLGAIRRVNLAITP